MESKIFAEVTATASERLAAAEVEKPDAGDPRAAIADAYNLQPSTYNFWAPEAYRKTYVRRFELGRGSTDAFAVLLNERCAIEKQVSDYYRQWSSKVVTAINTCTSSARFALTVISSSVGCYSFIVSYVCVFISEGEDTSGCNTYEYTFM